MEQAAQASGVTTMHADVEQQIFTLEGIVRDAKANTEEYAQLCCGSVSTDYALECETSRLQHTTNMHRDEIDQLNRSNEEMKES